MGISQSKEKQEVTDDNDSQRTDSDSDSDSKDGGEERSHKFRFWMNNCDSFDESNSEKNKEREHIFRFWLNKDDSDDESESVTVSRDKALDLGVTTIKQIQCLWDDAVAQGMHEPGKSILKSLSLRCPEVVQIFNYAQMDMQLKKHKDRVESGEIEDDPCWEPKDPLDFSVHSKRINDVVGEVVNNLPITPELDSFLKDVGAKHYCAKQFGFDPNVWDTFAECIVAKAVQWVVREKRSNKKVAKAWFNIIIHIVKTMKSGYRQEERRQEGWVSGCKQVVCNH